MESDAETILCIDDEAVVRKAIVHFLEPHGFAMLEAGDGEKGLEVFRAHRDRIALVLLDLKMPQMSGYEVFAALRSIDPAVPVLIITGHPQTMTEMARLEGIAGIVQKPVSPQGLHQMVRQVLDG